jgi:hypothetical protein
MPSLRSPRKSRARAASPPDARRQAPVFQHSETIRINEFLDNLAVQGAAERAEFLGLLRTY